MKKVLSLVLCIALVFGLCVPVFAATQEKEVKQYKKYLALGDSIAAGSGLDGYYDGWNAWAYCKDIPDAYPRLIAKAFGIYDANWALYSQDKFYFDQEQFYFNGAHHGMRVAELLDVLGNHSRLDDFSTEYYDMIYGGPWGLYNAEMYEPWFTGFLENADLITVHIGSNDLMGTLYYKLGDIFAVLQQEGKYEPAVQEMIAKAAELEIPEEAFSALLKGAAALDTVDMVKDLLVMVTEILNGAYDKFVADWEVLMEHIYTANHDVDLVVLGMYNPLANFIASRGLDPNSAIVKLLNAAFDPIVESYNYQMQYASKYHTDYVYVDTHFMEPVLAAGHYTDDIRMHPDAYGHQLLADAILAALDKVCCTHEHKMTLFAKKATVFEEGYTGDVICADCGALIEQGSIITRIGTTVEIPTGAVYSFAAMLIRQIYDLVKGLFAGLPTA